MENLNGQEIGVYAIEELIGQGGIARVYQAYDARFKRHIAIKILNRNELDIELVKERFQQEGQIIAALEHHAIVPVYDFGEHNGRPYIVMRLMRGGSLRERLENGPLSLVTAAEIFERIGSALDRAHDSGIIHRDIKPANILFDSDDIAFLADFGMARFTQLTISGMIIGSPHYMSPEQAKGKKLDRRSDVYQLGIVLYEMLAGRVPFDGESIEAVLYQHVHEAPRPLGEMVPGLSAPIVDLIHQSLAKDPVDRVTTAGELTGRLRELVSLDKSATLRPMITSRPTPHTPLADTVSDGPTPSPTGGQLPRPLWVWVAGALMLLAAAFILVGVWNAFAGDPPLETDTAGLPVPAGRGVDLAPTATGTAGPKAAFGRGTESEGVETPFSPTATPALVPVATPPLPLLLVEPALLQTLAGSDGLVYAADLDGQYDLFAWDGNGQARRLTTIEVDDFRPDWSADGSRIVYHSQRRNWEIYVMDADGANKRNLTDHPAQDTFPRWTHDGRIVFQSNREGEQFDLYVVDADGENLVRLTNSELDDTDPAVSVGGRLAFVRPVPITDQEAVPQIFVIDLGGEMAEQVTFDDRWGSFAPAWSPDGSRLAFYSTRTDGIPSIFVMEADGSSPILLTDSVDPSFYPSWSPNGEWIVYHRLMASEGGEDEGGNRDLWMVRVDGSEQIRMTDTAEVQERMPAFKP